MKSEWKWDNYYTLIQKQIDCLLSQYFFCDLLDKLRMDSVDNEIISH